MLASKSQDSLSKKRLNNDSEQGKKQRGLMSCLSTSVPETSNRTVLIRRLLLRISTFRSETGILSILRTTSATTL